MYIFGIAIAIIPFCQDSLCSFTEYGVRVYWESWDDDAGKDFFFTCMIFGHYFLWNLEIILKKQTGRKEHNFCTCPVH